jgi:hypothetical protein
MAKEKVEVVYNGYLAEVSIPDVGFFTRGKPEPVSPEVAEIVLALDGFSVHTNAKKEATE